MLDASTRAAFPGKTSSAHADDEGTRVIPARGRETVRPAEPEDAEEEEQTEAHDGVAETLIRWVPPLTAIICAGIALWGFVYYQFMM